MKKIIVLKSILYLGVIVLIFMTSLSFNSLRTLSLDVTKTIRIAQDRFKLDELESQIKKAIKGSPTRTSFLPKEVRYVDEKLLRFTQQLEGGKTPGLEDLKKKWEQLKNQSTPDSTQLIDKLDLLHGIVNRSSLDSIIKRESLNEGQISHLKILKIATGVLIMFLLFIGMYIDTLQTKENAMLLKKLQDLEKEQMKLPNSMLHPNSQEKIESYLDNI